MADRARRRIPEATVVRLPVYLRLLYDLAAEHVTTISSERLAELAGVNAAKVRKDLSYLGSYGTRGVGYDVDYLLHEISRELGLTRDWPVAIVGIGNLGRALANYRGFGARGFRIEALVDADHDLVGKEVGDLTIEPITELARIVDERKITIGMIATPAPVAQDVADRLVNAGVRSILNFAPAVLTVPRSTNVLASFSWMIDRLPSRPLELKISLRLGSNATASVPLPMGTAAIWDPLSVSITTRIRFVQLVNRRWVEESNAIPCGLVQLGTGQCASTLLLLVSMRTISFLSAPLT